MRKPSSAKTFKFTPKLASSNNPLLRIEKKKNKENVFDLLLMKRETNQMNLKNSKNALFCKA